MIRGREKLRVRIVDVSEGGVCLLSPDWLNPKQSVRLEIDVPGRATAKVQIEIWHIRREKSRTTSGRIWVAGAILRDSDKAYAELLEVAGLAPDPASASHRASATDLPGDGKPVRNPRPGPSPIPGPPTSARATASPPRPLPRPSPSATTGESERSAAPPPRAAAKRDASHIALDVVEPRVFRLHCKARGSPRTRVLTLAADSPEQARKLAEADLGTAWDLLEVREV